MERYIHTYTFIYVCSYLYTLWTIYVRVYTWFLLPMTTGVLIRTTPTDSGSRQFQPYDLTGENTFGWQGYSLTKGFFRNTNSEGTYIQHCNAHMCSLFVCVFVSVVWMFWYPHLSLSLSDRFCYFCPKIRQLLWSCKYT